MIGKYRKKPVEIDAVQWTGNNLFEIVSFINSKKPDITSLIASDRWDEYIKLVQRNGLKITTLEGDMSADIGDYIIKGIMGEFYPCKPDIFVLTYEKC